MPAAGTDNQRKHRKRAEKDAGGGMNDDHAGNADNDVDEEDLRAQMLNDIDEEDLLNMDIPPKPEPIMSSDGSGQRLMIHSIEVENFKSYYGNHVLGPFHQNFSAIIGPNGSGKSNVIDSLLFVFGYRASKIRSKKISVLIHSSKGHENLNSCTVCVNFHKIIDKADGKFDVVEGSDFRVSRTAFKDNSSKYTLNGKTVQFKDIARRLREVGIDLIHNRFLILQGEVEQIAMMKPKALTENDDGMLEYLEDIIGSSRLKVPIEKLQNKVESLQEERTGQLRRVKMAEKEKDELEGPVKGVLSELRVDNGVALCNNRLLLMDKVEAVSNYETEDSEQKKIDEELTGAKARQKEMTDSHSSNKKQLDAMQQELERAQHEFEKMTKKITENDSAGGKRKLELARLTDKKKKLNEDIKKETKKIDDTESVPAKAKAKIEEYEKVLVDIDQDIAQRQEETDENLSKFAKETQELQASKKTHEEKLGKLASTEDQAGSKLTLAQETVQQLRSEEEKERNKVSELTTSLDEARRLLEKKQSDLGKASKIMPNLESELESKQTEFTAHRKQEAECAENVRTARTKYESKRQTVEESRSANNQLNGLMKEKNSGSIPGIYGRLGDLGAIDQKYDVAISTTCGALDYIVVDTVDTAQRCVTFLKKAGLGIASFLVLEKQQHFKPQMKKPARTPENAPRMFDLIRVADQAVLPAFYYALRDTLVADDITTATRLGVGQRERHRVVTLKGEVVEASGTMTGGGRSEKKGRIGQDVKMDTSKDTAKEIAALKNYLQEEEERLADIRRSLHSIESRLQSMTNDRDRVKRAEQTLKAEIGPLEDKIRGLEKRLSEQKKRAKVAVADEDAIQKAEQNVEQLTKERNTACEAADEVRELVTAASNNIQVVYARLVEPSKKLLDEATAKKETASKGIAKEKGAVNNAERNLNKAKAKKQDMETDLQETEEQIEKIGSDTESQSQRSEELAKEKAELKEKVKEAETKLKETTKQFSEMDTEEVDLRRKVTELERQIEDQSGKVAHARALVAHIEKQQSALHLDYVQCIHRLPEHIREIDDEDDFALQEAIHDEHAFVKKIADNEVTVEADDIGIIRVRDLPVYTPEEIANFKMTDIRFQLVNLEKRKVGKSPSLGALQEYISKLERYDKELDHLKEITHKKEKHRDMCDKLKNMRLREFMEGFSQIGVALKEMYQMITLGGDASLDLVDSLDPFSEGVSFGVRPPKKSWKQITNLSGGEKTLSSLALVFALHHFRPTPLYVMDEIDAALDFRNVSIIGHYVKDRTKNAQFIIISLRNNMFELADRLVGIYKTFDCTKNVLIESSFIYNNMQNQRTVLDALGTVDLSGEDRAALQEARTNSENSEVRGDSRVEIEVPRESDDSCRMSLVDSYVSTDSASVSSPIDCLDIPPFQGTAKELPPDRKRQLKDFAKYVDRSNRMKEPLKADNEKVGSKSPPSKRQRSPRKKSSSSKSSESEINERKSRKSRRAALFVKPIIDIDTSDEPTMED